MKDFYISFEQIGRLLKERSKLIIFSAFIFTALYLYIVEFYGKSFGIFYYKKNPIEIPLLNPRPVYNFYSGGKNGVYHGIGKILEEADDDCFVKIKNNITSGGYENVLKVLGDSEGMAFGLVQEEAYKNDKMVRTELNYVTPIYMERLYIVHIKSQEESQTLRISNNTDVQTLKYLASSRIDIGNPNSGTHIISRYIINKLNDQIADYNRNSVEERIGYIKNVTNNTSSKTLSDLRADSTNVVLFMISGSPNVRITELFATDTEKKKFNIIGIEPDFTAALNDKYDINLHFSSFDNKHSNFSQTTTLGTFAWLVTNISTPPADIRQILEVLHDRKDTLTNMLKVPYVPLKSNEIADVCYKGKIQPPLCEFDFLGHYNNKNEQVVTSIWRNILLFFISLIPSTVLLFHVISVLLSVSKTDKYHDTLVSIMNNNIPANDLPSIFYFAKLNEGHDLDELSEGEYNNLKYNTIGLLLSKIDDKDGFKRYISKLRHQEIAKLITILITSVRAQIEWKRPEFKSVSGLAEKLESTNDSSFNEDMEVCKSVVKNTISSKYHIKPKAKAVKLLMDLLECSEVREFFSNTDLHMNEMKSTFDHRFIEPFVKQDQVSIINRIILGISKLHELKIRISEDYTDGLLTEKNYNFLFDKSSYVLDKMQKSLAVRFSGAMGNKNDLNLEIKTLRNYYVTNYLSRNDYYYLANKLDDKLDWSGSY